MKKQIYFLLMLTFCHLQAQEICGDGIDNDGNFLIDCAESACAGSGLCDNAIPCPVESTFYQVVDGTDFYVFDVESTNYQLVSENQLRINATGYNVEDGFIYGISLSSNNLLMIGADGIFQDLGPISGLPDPPKNLSYLAGDFNLNGVLYVYNIYSTSLYGVDIDSQSAIEIPLNISQSLGINDITFLPSTGLLYGMNTVNDHLYSINPINGNVIDLGAVDPAVCVGSFGASFTNASGNLFFFCNATGEIFEVNPSTLESSLFVDTDFQNLRINDGAACPFSNSVSGDSDCLVLPTITTMELSCNEFAFEAMVQTNDETLIVNYFWDFGDGNTSLLENPTHLYESDGTYTVTLTVTGVSTETGECCCLSKTIEVIVSCGCELIADFSQAFADDCNSFQFTPNVDANNVTEIIGYYWDFGDGTTSNEENPIHTFTENGEYQLSLTVAGIDLSTGECCCDTQNKTLILDCNEEEEPCGEIEGFSGGINGTFALLYLQTDGLDIEPGWSYSSINWTSTNNLNNDVQTSDVNGLLLSLVPDAIYEITVTVTLVNKAGETCEITYSEFIGPVGGVIKERFANESIVEIGHDSVSNSINLELNVFFLENEAFDITITSLEGKQLKKVVLRDGSRTTIDVSDLSSGTYSVNIFYKDTQIDAETLIIQ